MHVNELSAYVLYTNLSIILFYRRFSVDAEPWIDTPEEIRQINYDILVGKVITVYQDMSGNLKIQFYIKGQVNDQKYMKIQEDQELFDYTNLDSNSNGNFVFAFDNQS